MISGPRVPTKKVHEIDEESRGPIFGVKKWINKILKEKWTLSYDVGHRHGVMTTNYTELVNAMFESVKSMLMTTMMQ